AALSQEEVAEKVGKSRPTVANALRLLKLPAEMLEALRSGDLSPGHARAVLAVSSDEDRRDLFRRILAEGLSVREAEALAADLNAGKRPAPARKPEAPRRPLDPDLRDLEQKLIGFLGTKVQVKGDARKGSITIEYFSLDDLERVFDLMTGGKA
ncbi:MAG TPA: ParB/RepB/Spo0J family partition protein, partial [Spirochaetia bacterium]|nr:ParB/RepB/Spo0J family partition protein [Spirochaetia bacterium]